MKRLSEEAFILELLLVISCLGLDLSPKIEMASNDNPKTG
jgi:hypothetical protein